MNITRWGKSPAGRHGHPSQTSVAGNVRELVNAIEYAIVMAKGPQIMPFDLPETILGWSVKRLKRTNRCLSKRLKDLILRTLKDCHGNKHLARSF
jgi:DNA-binding NtrC family response regulator